MQTTFDCMGSEMALDAPTERAARGARRLLERMDRRLSRFDPASELSRLNADLRPTVPASALLRSAVRAAVWAAQRSDGLTDPTLLGALVAQGYETSLAHTAAASLRAALAAAPPRRPAQPHPQARWRAIAIDDERGTITRPPGVRIDTGASTKGLAADAVAHLLDGQPRYVVDCGGDLRIRAPRPIDVHVAHPLTGNIAHTLSIASGAVATSGIGRRLWRRGDRYAHHLLDPSTGEPAWTGLISATALAPTALEAETLAKTALLRGPAAARTLLAPLGGVLVHDSGFVEPVGRRSVRIVLEEVAA
jgi:thiamine biosynthesis lipoprotein